MVLDSQMGRAGAGRQYMSSRRKRGPLRLIAALLVVAGVGFVCWRMIAGGDDAGPNQANADNSPTIEQPGGHTTIAPQPRDPALTTPQHAAPLPQPKPQPKPKPKPQPKRVEQPQPKPQPKRIEQPAPTPSRPQLASNNEQVNRQITQALKLVQQNRLAEGRAYLNQVLASDISAQLAEQVRREMSAVNEKLVFSPLIDKHDPFSSQYVIRDNDALSRIAPPHKVPWQFIQKINRIPRPERIRPGQRIKIIEGPFHVVITKSQYRADIYLGEGQTRMYVRSYRVGLGEFNSTPTGAFVVKRGSKLENPEWHNPRNSKYYAANDPTNPIGERWIGLQGIDENTRELRSYGLHGTIEPESIGKQASMGCIRFLPEDIIEVFDMLVGGKSTVVILP